jgi:hypothetical protein
MLLYNDLTQKQRDWFLTYVWNGVGSREYIKPPQLIFEEASKWHDFGYFRGGNEDLRKEVDREFFHKAHSAVRKQPIAQRPFYYAMSYVYFYGLKKLGSKAWELYPEPAKTWEEFVDRVFAFFDREPDRKDRPPNWVE